MGRWIGVDLDGTLAKQEQWQGIDHIGEPIPAMVARVRRWIAAGQEVRIFTARVTWDDERVQQLAIHYVEEWCKEHIGTVLPVTNVKDMEMIELWDDRAVGVERNTGAVLSGRSRLDEELEPALAPAPVGSSSQCEHGIALGDFCASCLDL